MAQFVMRLHRPAKIYFVVFLALTVWIYYIVNFTANRAELIGLPLVVLTLPLSLIFAEARTGWFSSEVNDGLFVLGCIAVVNLLVIEVISRLADKR